MSTTLPPRLADLRGFLPELVAEAMKTVPYACCLVTESGGESVVKTPSAEQVNPIPPRPGIRISVWDGATFHSLSTSRLFDRDYLLRQTRDLAASVSVKAGPTPSPGGPFDRHFASGSTEELAATATARRLDLCRHAFEVLKSADRRINAAQASCAGTRELRLFCSPGRLLSSDINRHNLMMFAFAGDGRRQAVNYDIRAGDLPDAATADDDECREVAVLAARHLDAEKVPPGEYRVILDPDVTGTLAHESFGHGCELDTMARGAARALQYVGRRVGSDLVNIVDFGGRPGHHGSLFFSDDGVLSEEPVVLVKDGILQPTMMTDLWSYTVMHDRLPGLGLSANGRLESYDHPVYARMTNTYFQPLPADKGGMTLDELVTDTGDGILIEKLTSGMEDPLGWGVQLQCLRGREIKAGALTDRLYYQVGLTGYVPDVLASVDGLTTDLRMESAGTCGKGHKE
ncbi:TldD/PmbA family protein, partial [candidate division WOR-3 bacterium]|nr:TldD/PmbA family protein [candidate division WOR-3 bacterium]